VSDAFIFAVNCHCSLCRRSTGSAFEALAGIEHAKLRITKGEDRVLIVAAPSWHDERCQQCGSLLFAVLRDGAFAHVAIGSLVDDPNIARARTSSSALKRRGLPSRTTYHNTTSTSTRKALSRRLARFQIFISAPSQQCEPPAALR
jgi:hypothetical protein